MTKLQNPFYVSHVGHRWAICPVAYPTLERALEEARASCGDAWETRVYDCSESHAGRLVTTFFANGTQR